MYQNVSSPRIYLNLPEFLASTGTVIDNVFRTLPVGVHSYTDSTTVAIPSGMLKNQCFVAILGHKLKTYGANYGVTEAIGFNDVINGTPSSGRDGFSISTFDGTGSFNTTDTTECSSSDTIFSAALPAAPASASISSLVFFARDRVEYFPVE